jgi:hypothetical protein
MATILAAVLVAAGPAPAKDALPRCAWTAPQHGPRGLPATLSLETRCADFRLQPNGSLRPQGHGIVYDEAPRGSIGDEQLRAIGECDRPRSDGSSTRAVAASSSSPRSSRDYLERHRKAS